MMEALIIGGQPETAALVADLAATLPLSYRPAASQDEGRSAVEFFAGDQPWATRVAESSSDKSWIVVVDPGLDDADAISSLADKVEAGSARIAFSESYAGDPAVELLRGQIAFAVTSCKMHGVTSGSLAGAIFTQVRLARAIGLRSLAAKDVCAVDGGALVTFSARFGEGDVQFGALATISSAAAPRHVVKAYGAGDIASLTLFGSDTARPGEAAIIDATGERQLPTIYETAHRALLRGLREREPLTPQELRDFATDVRLVQSLDLV